VACTQAQNSTRPYGAPKPHLYEGTFAHEYQHLLEYYQDPDEVSWVNEGLSDYAQSLVGYVDTSVPVTDPSADSHIACFTGFMAGEGYGGPENSLTQWQDQGGPEILCDYGAAYSFMQYLYGHYGEAFLSALHKEPGNGLQGLQNVLDANNAGVSAMDVVHRWAATMALDNVVDGGASLTGGDAAAYSEQSLGSQINWDATYDDINHDGTLGDVGNEAYSTPGAPPNGSDYVRLGDGTGSYYDAGQLTDLTFDGAGSLAPRDVAWTTDATPPDATAADTSCGSVPDGTGSAALYSGCGPNLDRAITRTVTVPASDPTLTFRTLYDTEPGWDFGFVQVYDAAQGKYVSVACTDTTTDHDPGAIPAVQGNLPGFSGDSGTWKDESCDLTSYAGQEVELAFRYVTDSGVNEAGWWVDDVKVGGSLVSDGSSLDGWQSATQAHPTPVSGYTVQLVAYDDAGTAAWVGTMPLTQGADGDFHGTLSGTALHSMVGDSAQTVAALVMQDDPSETVDQYARYTLTANGVTQPGG
ncbi:MAG TPA: choice-of-anchor J domain-containing protein, partial [Nocardioidaceae bacterium]|nr:choice-of-anchor J domain-containing protein [Nocardioidaceae bacterium]